MNLKTFTQDEQHIIIEKYQSGQSAKTIANEFNCSQNVILNLLRKCDIEIRTKAGISKVDFDPQEVIELYNSGKSAYEIQKIVGCKAVNTIYNFIRKHCEIRNGWHDCDWNKNINKDFFKEPLSERAQYWLGFLFADGSVYPKGIRNPVISLEVSAKDGWLIEEFKKDLNLDNRIQYIHRHNKDYVRIQFSNKEISDDLQRHGITHNKTWHIEKFVGNEQTLTGHMLRGFLDGDGWISLTSNGIGAVVGFVGNWYSMEIIKWLLGYKVGCNKDVTICCNPETNDWPKIVYYRLDDIYKLYSFMYKNATLYLSRKKDKFIKLFQNRKDKNLSYPAAFLEGNF